ncbi:hypothetical protein GPECTOR_46g233 [Gonium pectorale]|uniref:Uncharacterized protein n=1 Tax=Gonium pectorale TaxID=33097 RepID=A0A150G8K2_GONPE|nr:hypothetical protein GPECTOR_46g233 [Gonium pectorale]|eukprot:KXZ46164.1 hypothetical protein GPECTOR_46g233 [Gonium pectorale]
MEPSPETPEGSGGEDQLDELLPTVADAIELLRLFAAADAFPRGGLFCGFYGLVAALRYEHTWLQVLRTRFAATSIPPLDVALAWVIHRQLPAQYAASMRRQVGREVLHTPRERALAFSGELSQGWAFVTEEGSPTWPPPEPGTPHDPTPALATRRNAVAIKLAERMPRFARLLRSWLRPHFLDPAFLERARIRYVRFLALLAASPLGPGCPPLVPAADVALMWHTHLALSGEYEAAARRLFGTAAGWLGSGGVGSPGGPGSPPAGMMATQLIAIAHVVATVDSSDHPFLRAMAPRFGLWAPEEEEHSAQGKGQQEGGAGGAGPMAGRSVKSISEVSPAADGGQVTLTMEPDASPTSAADGSSVPASGGMLSGSPLSLTDLELLLDDPALVGLARLVTSCRLASAASIARSRATTPGSKLSRFGRAFRREAKPGAAPGGDPAGGGAGPGPGAEPGGGLESPFVPPPGPAGGLNVPQPERGDAPIWALLHEPMWRERPAALFSHLWRETVKRGFERMVPTSLDQLKGH